MECKKLSKEAIDLHFSNFLEKVVLNLGPLASKTLVSTHMHSWEIGAQNWTQNFPIEFKKRCGYDIVSFLPAITGRVVGDLLQILDRNLNEPKLLSEQTANDCFRAPRTRRHNRRRIFLYCGEYFHGAVFVFRLTISTFAPATTALVNDRTGTGDIAALGSTQTL